MNNDLISRSALIAEFERIYEAHYKCTCYQFIHDIFKAMFRRFKNAPAVDAVEVCRCKDCKYRSGLHGRPPLMFRVCTCTEGLTCAVRDDNFCSYGERKDGADG